MKSRQNQGLSPQITFTSDFHELVQGDLIPGPCVLRYDPLRLLDDEPLTGDHHIVAHVRFHPSGEQWRDTMLLAAGAPMQALANPSGQGLMLESAFPIPEGCKELEVWFQCTHESGQTHWDSNYGKNYWLRFPLSDLKLSSAQIVSRNKARDAFEISIQSDPSIDHVSVRWWMTNLQGAAREVVALLGAEKGGKSKTWSSPKGGIPVPKNATVAFDIVYTIGNRKFTDDNQGRWYLADETA